MAWAIPVATTVTLTSFSILGSMAVPITMVALSEEYSLMALPTSSNSRRDIPGPELTFTNMPLAPARLTSSSNGLDMADSAALRARSSPEARPAPIMAIPISPITVRTSAKSTFIRPGEVISSAMPCTACNNTSLAVRKASINEISWSSTLNRRWFGIIIKESTYCPNSLMPCVATRSRLPPSKANGLVTTATVRMPISLAISAMTGAAPVPVPPPMPAVMNTMSAPSMAPTRLSRSSMAALRPMSGLVPAPRPLVMLLPMCNFNWARLFCKA